MAAHAAVAVEYARQERGLVLDYTPESVEQVEAILAWHYSIIPRSFIHRLFRRRIRERGIRLMAAGYGSYIGETIRRTWGGSWQVDHPVNGPGSFPLTCRGQDAFPILWCDKRLRNGPEDNVWHKFKLIYLVDPWGAAEE